MIRARQERSRTACWSMVVPERWQARTRIVSRARCTFGDASSASSVCPLGLVHNARLTTMRDCDDADSLARWKQDNSRSRPSDLGSVPACEC